MMLRTRRRKAETDLAERVMLAELSADIGASLTKPVDLRGMLQGCTDALVRHLDVAFARIWTVNADDDVLELQASAGLTTAIDGSHSRVPFGAFMFGPMTQERKPLLTNSVVGNPRIHDQDWARREGMQSFAGHPLTVGDKLVGVMAIFGRTPLTEVVTRSLASVSSGIAIGIERKRAVDALQAERRLFLGGPNVAFTWKAAEGWPVEYVSPNVEAQFGYPPEAFTSGEISYASIVHPDDRARVAQEVTAHSGGLVPFFEQEYRIARADGEYRWVYDFTAVARDPNGVITHYHGHIADITDRKQAERAVALLSFALNNVREAAFLTDEDGRLQFVNEESCRVLGYSRAELLGLTVPDIDPDFPADRWLSHWEELKTRQSLLFEGRHRASDGHILPVEINANYFEYDGKGYNLALARDITERTRADAALRRLNRELRAISSCNEALLRTQDEQLLLNGVCRIVCDEAGYGMAWVGYAEHDDAKTVRPVAWAGVEDGYLTESGLTWDDSERCRSAAGTAIRTGESCCIQDFAAAPQASSWHESALRRGYRSSIALPLKYRSGEAFGALSMYSTEPNAVTPDEVRLLEELSGDLAYGIVALRTRAERAKAEDTLRKLSMAVEQSPASIIITDTAGSIEYVNPRFTEVTGYVLAEVLGKKPSMLRSGKTPTEEYEQVWRTIRSGKAWHGEFESRKKSGESFWEEASIWPIFDAAGALTHFVAVNEDTTRRRRLEEEFRQAQKLEAVGQLAGGVAHDFNNILAVILMNLGLMMADERVTPEVKAGLEELEHAANRAASLTRQLLLFSRRQVLDAKLLDLSEVVNNMTKMLRRLIGEDIDLVFQGQGTELWITADAGMMDQVLMNLCVNARDAMPSGGRLKIGTRRIEVTEESAATIPGARAGSFICLSVTDTGCGMDEETLKHIFEPFFTTKEAGRGTGLGLATVHGIVSQHRGFIQVESAPGNGSAFHVYLPESRKAQEVRVAPGAADVPRGTEVVLLVEDDASLRRLMSLGLRKHGYVVFEAADGQEALRVWESHGQEVDVLLTDMIMPGRLSGLDLAERLMKAKPALSVIVTSGYTTERSRAETLRARGIVYLSKPYDIAELAKTVRACLGLAAGRAPGG